MPVQRKVHFKGLRSITEEGNWTLPHCGGSDDPNEEDPAPAERMRGLEYEDMLQEKGVQFCELLESKDTGQK